MSLMGKLEFLYNVMTFQLNSPEEQEGDGSSYSLDTASPGQHVPERVNTKYSMLKWLWQEMGNMIDYSKEWGLGRDIQLKVYFWLQYSVTNCIDIQIESIYLLN